MLIGNRWRELRKERGFSTNDLTTRAGLLPGDLSDIEHGRSIPSKSTFENVARYLNVPVSILFYDDENPPELLIPPKRKADRTGNRHRKDTQELAELRILLTPVAHMKS
jgi:transcriptional regulator with XRE-family HTH domain